MVRSQRSCAHAARRSGAAGSGRSIHVPDDGTGYEALIRYACYRASPNEATSRSMVDPLRRNDFIYGVVVTPFDEVL
jgi:hypothetical protein